MTTERRRRLKALLKARRLTTMLITSAVDVAYLSGFTGEDSFLLLTRGADYLITDGRFTEQVAKECPRLKAVIRKGPMAEAVAGVIRRRKIRSLAFDADYLTVAAGNRLGKALGRGVRLRPMTDMVSKLRQIKDAGEVRAICRAIKIAEDAFRRLVPWIKPGRSEREIAARLEWLMLSLGADRPAFKTIVAVGPRASLPHASPTSRRLPKRGGLILIDWGAMVDGYVSDLTRVLFAGKIPVLVKHVHEIVCRAQAEAIKAMRPGADLKAVDSAARLILKDEGYEKAFVHGTGHGIGREVHEPPPAAPRSRGKMQPGMVITAEPGVYLPGKFGVRVEDDVLVTGSGCRVLSHLKKGPWIVRV
jgi:Xaa-Pro aminopeptidase